MNIKNQIFVCILVIAIAIALLFIYDLYMEGNKIFVEEVNISPIEYIPQLATMEPENKRIYKKYKHKWFFHPDALSIYPKDSYPFELGIQGVKYIIVFTDELPGPFNRWEFKEMEEKPFQFDTKKYFQIPLVPNPEQKPLWLK